MRNIKPKQKIVLLVILACSLLLGQLAVAAGIPKEILGVEIRRDAKGDYLLKFFDGAGALFTPVPSNDQLHKYVSTLNELKAGSRFEKSDAIEIIRKLYKIMESKSDTVIENNNNTAYRLAVAFEAAYRELSGRQGNQLVQEVRAEYHENLQNKFEIEIISKHLNKYFTANIRSTRPLRSHSPMEAGPIYGTVGDLLWVSDATHSKDSLALIKQYLRLRNNQSADVLSYGDAVIQKVSEDLMKQETKIANELVDTLIVILNEILNLRQETGLVRETIVAQATEPINIANFQLANGDGKKVTKLLSLIWPNPEYSLQLPNLYGTDLAARVFLLDAEYKKIIGNPKASLVSVALLQVFHDTIDRINRQIRKRLENNALEQEMEASRKAFGGMNLYEVLRATGPLNTPAQILNQLGYRIHPYGKLTDDLAIEIFETTINNAGGIKQLSTMGLYGLAEELAAIDEAFARKTKKRPIQNEINRFIRETIRLLKKDYAQAVQQLSNNFGILKLATEGVKAELRAALNPTEQTYFKDVIGIDCGNSLRAKKVPQPK